MPNLAKVIRHASPKGLLQFCQSVGIPLPSVASEHFSLEQTIDVEAAIDRIRKTDLKLYQRAEQQAARVVHMSTPSAQQVLVQQVGTLWTGNPYDNVAFLMHSDNAKLEQAESSRFASHYRYGRMWDSYQLTPAVDPDETISLDTLCQHLSQTCQNQRFRADSFCYQRRNHRGKIRRVQHIAFTRQGVPQSVSELDEQSQIQVRTISPAKEYALTHEWGTGVVEVVANTRDMRDLVSLLYAQDVLRLQSAPVRITPRQFGLDPFRYNPSFSYSLNDGLALIHVVSLSFISLRNGQPMNLEVPKELRFVQDIYQVSSDNDQLKTVIENEEVWRLVEAVVGAQKRQVGSSRRSEIFVELKYPNSCSLRELTPDDRVLMQRVLVDSGLVDEDNL